jgi:triosephosphate isomerase
MIRPVIAGNWKMNKTIAEAVDFAARLRDRLESLPDREVIIAPPFTALKSVADILRGSRIGLAAQTLHEAEKGAYTGEVSAGMLRDAGCSCVLFGEGNEAVNRKLRAALAGGLKPIFCVGETLQERESEKTRAVIERQLKEGLNNLSADDIGRCLIAYEPVWAIGTGKTASPAQAQEVHRFIREWIAAGYGNTADGLAILYGGSVTPRNISELMAEPDINGALVGGASLEVSSFVQIIAYE